MLDNKALRRITMGMSASQARFLQLTARKSNVEYQAQRINFERLQLADKDAAASAKYNDQLSNRKLVFRFNDNNNAGNIQEVDVTYNNYKNYMNKQLEGFDSSAKQLFLVSSSGNKIIVASEAEKKQMMDLNQNYYSKEQIETAKETIKNAAQDDTIDSKTKFLASLDVPEGESGCSISKFSESDFVIAEDLDNPESFQRAIQEGIYYFATFDEKAEGGPKFKTEAWDNLQSGSIKEEYDKSDDAKAQSEYDKAHSLIQSQDKKLELQLDKLNTEREALETEMESVQKVIDDNIESSFKVFS